LFEEARGGLLGLVNWGGGGRGRVRLVEGASGQLVAKGGSPVVWPALGLRRIVGLIAGWAPMSPGWWRVGA
jgi:hypothetical protein